MQKFGNIGGGSPCPALKVTGWPLVEKFRKPGLVLGFLMENRKRQVVSPMIFSRRDVADIGIPADGAALRLHQNLQHRLDVSRVPRQFGRRSGREVVKDLHIIGYLPPQFVDSRHQCLEVITVLYTGVLRDHLKPFPFQPD